MDGDAGGLIHSEIPAFAGCRRIFMAALIPGQALRATLTSFHCLARCDMARRNFGKRRKTAKRSLGGQLLARLGQSMQLGIVALAVVGGHHLLTSETGEKLVTELVTQPASEVIAHVETARRPASTQPGTQATTSAKPNPPMPVPSVDRKATTAAIDRDAARPPAPIPAAVQITMCGSGARINCVVDGDTIWLGGQNIRIADIDTPEIFSPQCAAERERGERAARRLQQLVNAGPIELRRGLRDEDRYGRKLRTLHRDGRSLGDILVAEGLARKWDGARRGWCA
jgi:endonuclease YncB( thermonuclease family)